ncbi:unnamed protein product [Protopolystoma xenopodis]|uniref:Uncharacterized protein n=1 Tax=Protopolystoma xenopodis TaxID=117903 RepID=A0A3S5AJ09_9PLAT|nr:unnamed protein product [Protopolystoma xenopodis]
MKGLVTVKHQYTYRNPVSFHLSDFLRLPSSHLPDSSLALFILLDDFAVLQMHAIFASDIIISSVIVRPVVREARKPEERDSHRVSEPEREKWGDRNEEVNITEGKSVSCFQSIFALGRDETGPKGGSSRRAGFGSWQQGHRSEAIMSASTSALFRVRLSECLCDVPFVRLLIHASTPINSLCTRPLVLYSRRRRVLVGLFTL